MTPQTKSATLPSMPNITLGLNKEPQKPNNAPVGSTKQEFTVPQAEVNPTIVRQRLIQSAATIIEQVYWSSGAIPSPDKFLELWPKSDKRIRTRTQVLELYSAADLVSHLNKKGIPSPSQLEQALTVEQMVAINVMLNPMDQRSERAKLDTVNELLEAEGYQRISMFKWNNWRHSQAFVSVLQSRANVMFESADYKWYQALEQQVSNGDVSAMKLFAAARGINLEPERVRVEVDIASTVSTLFEILAEFVTPAILQMIGERLDERLRSSSSFSIEVSGSESNDNQLPVSS